MDSKTKGAWIIHHKEKIDVIAGVQAQFDQINFAGKCSTLLSSISQTKQAAISASKINTLATANGISIRVELASLLAELERQKLISKSKTGIEVLALTSGSILEYTSRIYEEAGPSKNENAAIELSELVSDTPALSNDVEAKISDTFQIESQSCGELIKLSSSIGFIDAETLRNGKSILYNGNLFKKDDMNKMSHILSGLSNSEVLQMKEVNTLLDTSGCLPLEDVIKITGTELFNKLHSIALYEVNSVSNEYGEYYFVTKPSSFCKYSKTMADDAFDLAKAFVTSLTYGMTSSEYGRGRIRMIEALMNKLIAGQWVGPATAIGEDYKILELRGVIQTQSAKGKMYLMKLLKEDVGKLALLVIKEGVATTNVLRDLPGASISAYEGPERNRTIRRKSLTKPLRSSISDLLDSLRTGAI